jgi:UPF0755 protein
MELFRKDAGRMKFRTGVIPIALFALFVAAVMAVAALFQFFDTPASKDRNTLIVSVAPGQPFSAVARKLQEEGLVTDAFRLTVLARAEGVARKIQAGEYEFSASMSPRQILDAMVSGRVRLLKVTIPEGFTMKDIGRRLEDNGITNADGFLKLARDPKFVSSLGIQGKTLEGYLYPDTYRFFRNTDPEKVIKIMVDRWRSVFDQFRERVQQSDMNELQIMTLASIVEKETALPKEKPLVASVYLNRLKKNMRLYADPTVIYGIESFDGNITKDHLRTDTPYNTYLRHGLPPGPIASPDKESIAAVLDPAHTNYLYFVSRNDGSHEFSSSYRAHRRAVRKYQR